MRDTVEIKKACADGIYDEILLDIYVDENMISYQKDRYIRAIEKFEELYGRAEVSIYSAPGRSEIGGNHTDHQQGEVLAAAINLDAIAVVRKTMDGFIRIVSDDFEEIIIDSVDLSLNKDEAGTTRALVKGVCKGLVNRGYHIGGFDAYITSDVLIGAGLSSSAAFETLVGTILSGEYNHGKLDPVEAALIGQYAENVYFGKPCGLMDQMACSVGSLVHIDFKEKEKPVVKKLDFDLNSHGYSLCITDTKGSHADLTSEYAAIPEEMKAVAGCFNKEVLAGISMEDLLENAIEIREKCSDRAFIRAIHFIKENERVEREVEALNNKEIEEFLNQVRASGDSSFKFLQNVYTNNDVYHQNISVALSVSEVVLEGGLGVSRVHGGGFAGTIQAFVKNQAVDKYLNSMDSIFGQGSCKVLKIRKYGGIRIDI